MKAIAPITNAKLKRLAVGVSSLVVAMMTIGTTATAAASQHTDHNTPKKTQGSVQNNKNQRNTRNYNITYNINNYFDNRSQKPLQRNKTNSDDRYSFKNRPRTETPQKSNYSQKVAQPTSYKSPGTKQNRVYTETRWVYDSRLCRWVEIGYNKSTSRWELTYVNDRKDSRHNNPQDTRNYSYWYND